MRGRVDNFGTEVVVRGGGAGSQLEWRGAIEEVEERVRAVEEMVESNTEKVERAIEMCRAKGESADQGEVLSSRSSSSATVLGIREELRRVEAKMEEREQEARKYFLLITKLRRTRRWFLAFLRSFDNLDHVDLQVGKTSPCHWSCDQVLL